jgi:hypothetical protein
LAPGTPVAPGAAEAAAAGEEHGHGSENRDISSVNAPIRTGTGR